MFMANYNQKLAYFAPQIERIVLDNEISLTLDSSPPVGPGGGYLIKPEYLNNDPFKTNQA